MRSQDFQPGDRVALVKWPYRGKRRRTATLIRSKKWFGQRAWLVDLDGGWLNREKAGAIRTTVTERVMEPLREEPSAQS